MKRWIAAGVFVCVLLGLGAVLAPSVSERSFMHLRDKDYAAAQQSFEERWANGDRSRQVANALVELHIRLGEIDKAADTLLTYVNAHPHDAEATTRLAELFRDAQMRDKYMATLEKLVRERKEPATMRQLEKVYDMAGKVDERIKVLRELVMSREAEPNDHIELAALLAANDERGALEVLYNVFRRWPSEVDTETAQAFVALAADNERDDLVRAVVFPWIATRKDHTAVDALVTTLSAKRKVALALELAKKSGALAKSVPQTVVLTARLETRSREGAAAFARLDVLRKAKQLPTSGDDVYVEAALQTGKRDAALEHVLSRGPEHLPYWMQSWVVAKAAEAGDDKFLKAMQTQFAKGETVARSFMLSRIALALGNRDEARRLAARAKPLATDTASAIAVAGLLVDIGETGEALRLFVNATPDPASVAVDDLPSAVSVAIAVRDVKRAMTMAEALRTARPGQVSDVLYARALTLSGRGKEAIEILEDYPQFDDAVEVATFEALKATGQIAQLQTELFDRFNNDDASLSRRTNYVYMLNDAKVIVGKGANTIVERLADDLDNDELQGSPRLSRIELLAKISPKRAKPYALDAAEADPDRAGYLYLGLMKKLGDKQGAAKYISNVIGDVKSEKTKRELLFAWIEIGVTPAILPHLRERAERGDKEWFFAYDEALRKLGMNDERIAFLTEYASRSDLDPEFRRQIAHGLLSGGNKSTALTLFKTLATDAPAKSPDVEQVLFIWGPRPPAEGLQWLQARATAATGAERALWLDRLVDGGAARQAAEIGTKFYAAGDRSVAPVLADAYAQSKQDQALKLLLQHELKLGVEQPNVLALAQAADARSLYTEAGRLYEQAATRDPKWIAPAARSVWAAGERAHAITLFEQAATQPTIDAETLFQYAEALRVQKRKGDAQPLYDRVLALLKGDTKATRRLRVLSLARLGRYDEANALVNASSDNGLRADYAAALIDGGKLSEAGQVLNASDVR